MKNILLLVMVLLFTGCGTRKKEFIKERILIKADTLVLRDTIFSERIKTVLMPSVNSDYITNPCDSTGILKNFSKTLNFPSGTAKIKSENGNIKIIINTDSISSVYEKQYRSKYEKAVTDKQSIEKEKNKIEKSFQFWQIAALVSLAFNLVFVFYFIVKGLWGRII